MASSAAVSPHGYVSENAASDAAAKPSPTVIAGEPASTSGDDHVAHGRVDMSKVAAEEVLRQSEAEASNRSAKGERRSAIHTFPHALMPSRISIDTYLMRGAPLSAQVRRSPIRLPVS